MAAEIRTAARIAASMDAATTQTLCAGMPPSVPGRETGCLPEPGELPMLASGAALLAALARRRR